MGVRHPFHVHNKPFTKYLLQAVSQIAFMVLVSIVAFEVQSIMPWRPHSDVVLDQRPDWRERMEGSEIIMLIYGFAFLVAELTEFSFGGADSFAYLQVKTAPCIPRNLDWTDTYSFLARKQLDRCPAYHKPRHHHRVSAAGLE